MIRSMGGKWKTLPSMWLGGMRRMAVERRRKHRGIFEANKKEAQQLGTGDWCRQVDIKRRADREWLESAAEMKTENAGVTHTHIRIKGETNATH
jgi:hypothetical protein